MSFTLALCPDHTYLSTMIDSKHPNAHEDKGHGRDHVGILKSRDDFSPTPQQEMEEAKAKTHQPQKGGGSEMQ